METLQNFILEIPAYFWRAEGMLSSSFQGLYASSSAVLAAAVILLTAGLSLVWFVFGRIWPAHRLIQITSRAVEGTADPASFTANFPRFDRAVNEMPLLRRPWLQYRVGIFVPPQSARAAIRHHLRAGDYLHVEALEAGGFNFRFFKSWGGFFFGAGLFFTLLGITADLLAFSGAPGAGQGNWTSGLAYKLFPLLAGMLSGLALAAAYHWAENRLRRDMQRLSAALEERVMFSSAPAPAPQYLQLTGAAGASAAGPADNTAMLPEHLRNLSRDVVGALSQIETLMTNALPGRIGEAMQPLSQALDLLGKRLSETNAEALRQAVAELSQGLHARAVEDLDALSGALAHARNGLEEAGAALREASNYTSEQLSRAGREIAGNLGKAGEAAQQAFAPLPQQAAQFAESLERINTGLTRHGASVAEAAESARRAIAAMDEILSRQREMAPGPVYPEMVRSQAPMVDMMIVDDLSRAARDMSSSVDAVTDARRLLKRLSGRLRQPSTSLITEDWAQYSEALSGSDEVLNEVLENFRQGASHQRAGLDAAVEELESRLERLFRDLDSGAGRLESAIQTMRQYMQSAPAPVVGPPPAANESDDAA